MAIICAQNLRSTEVTPVLLRVAKFAWAVPLSFVTCALIDTTHHPSGGISVRPWAAGLLPVFACFCSTCLSELRHFDLSVVGRSLTDTQLTLRSEDQSYRADMVTAQFITKFIKR